MPRREIPSETTFPLQIRRRRGRALVGAALALVLAFGWFAVPAQAVPKRVVALTPFAANSMALMGAFPDAVGQTLGGDRRLVSGLRNTPVLTLSHPFGPNMEQLATIAPQVVFSSPQWAKGTSSMKALGARVVEADPESIKGVYGKVRQIASIVGRRDRGLRLERQIRAGVTRSTRGIVKRPRVMLILGVGRAPFTFLGNSWGGEIVRKAGGRLVTGGASSRSGFARISDDIIVKANPSVIIAVPHANTDDIPAAVEFLKTNPAWASTSAALNDRIYVSTDNSLLQAGTDIGRTISKVRGQYLKND